MHDQGVNSAALQVSDGLFSTVAIVVASTIFAAGHTAAGEDAAVFAAIFAVMVGVALAGAAAAPRMRPPSDDTPTERLVVSPRRGSPRRFIPS